MFVTLIGSDLREVVTEDRVERPTPGSTTPGDHIIAGHRRFFGLLGMIFHRIRRPIARWNTRVNLGFS